MEPIRPRKISTRPANASRRPTHKNGTREIASITKPSKSSESPRVHCSVRDHHCTGLNSARNPHKITATLSSNQPGFRRSNRMCPVRPSHTTSPPSSTKIISMVIRSNCCGVSILCCDLCHSLRRFLSQSCLLHSLDAHFVQSNRSSRAVAGVAGNFGNLIGYVLAFDDLAENRVLIIKPGRRGDRDEKLTAVGSWTTIRHREFSSLGMFQGGV